MPITIENLPAGAIVSSSIGEGIELTVHAPPGVTPFALPTNLPAIPMPQLGSIFESQKVIQPTLSESRRTLGVYGGSMAMRGVEEVPGMLPTMGELPIGERYSGLPPLYQGPGERGETTQQPFQYKGPGERPGDPVSETTVAEALKGQQVLEAGIGWPLFAGAALAAIGQLWGGGGGEAMTMAGGEMVRGEISKGSTAMSTGMMPPVSGPGTPSPPKAMIAKYWKTKAFSHTVGEYWVHFFKLIDGRIMSWNGAKEEWKIWRPKKHVVISNNPRMSQIRKLERLYDRTIRKLAKKSKALKLA